jgi:hypothetical protein
MVPKHELPNNISLHGRRLNCGTNICELEDHVGEKGWNLNWLKTFGPTKKTPISFPNYMLKNTWIEFTFPYYLSPCHGEVKRNTIGVVGKINAKLPHCTNLVLVYPMENQMSLVHHVVERCRCGYIDKDDKCLNERTQRHLMLKPKSKLM